MAWLVSDARVLASAEVATSGAQRRRGLRGRDAVEGAFVLPRCSWVHTFGMRVAIDVAFVAADGTVVKMVRMRPWRLGSPVRAADWTVEAAVGAFERWGLSVGDVIELRDGPES